MAFKIGGKGGPGRPAKAAPPIAPVEPPAPPPVDTQWYTPPEDVTETLPDGTVILLAVGGIRLPVASARALGIAPPSDEPESFWVQRARLKLAAVKALEEQQGRRGPW